MSLDAVVSNQIRMLATGQGNQDTALADIQTLISTLASGQSSQDAVMTAIQTAVNNVNSAQSGISTTVSNVDTAVASIQGSISAMQAGVLPNQQAFTANGNFTVPANTYLVFVTGCGGGQASSQAKIFGNAAYIMYRQPVFVKPNTVIPVTIGQGGAYSTLATPEKGTATLFGSKLSLPGGGYTLTAPTIQSLIEAFHSDISAFSANDALRLTASVVSYFGLKGDVIEPFKPAFWAGTSDTERPASLFGVWNSQNSPHYGFGGAGYSYASSSADQNGRPGILIVEY